MSKKKRIKKGSNSAKESHFSTEKDGISGAIISDIDRIHKAVLSAMKIDIDMAAKAANVSRERAEELSHILEKKGLIKIKYTFFGRQILYAKDFAAK